MDNSTTRISYDGWHCIEAIEMPVPAKAESPRAQTTQAGSAW